MNTENSIEPSRLVTLRITDAHEYYKEKRGKEYKCSVTMVMAGQNVAIEDLMIPDNIAKEIVTLCEKAAVTRISETLQLAGKAIGERHEQARIAALQSAQDSTNSLLGNDNAENKTQDDDNDSAF